ncbi:hypothetical protein IE81DRAFT_220678 [Ceraceosorus guamensis]|uniref:Transmembrane protein n=1 Tax=Ceraceosorus guamensis TaxID=1522189 RepID=A0A316VTS0_9BASI|nr:hypothetical protein IE81DRAFT_220678 [Ceraceosorus guamensis]PWN40438.1 hypothetical protein IE81DRAFT_220678 [Ceraceosorus guamensis]
MAGKMRRFAALSTTLVALLCLSCTTTSATAMAIFHGVAAQDTLYLGRPSFPIISRVRGLFKSKPSLQYNKLDTLPRMHRMSDSFRLEDSHHAQAKAASERSAKVKKKFTIWRGQFTRKSAAGAVSGLFGTVSAANAVGALWEKLIAEPTQMSGQRDRKSSIPSERRSFGPARLKVINASSKALRPRALETGEVLSVSRTASCCACARYPS